MRNAPPRAVWASRTGRKEVRLLVFGRTRLPARYREIYAYTLRQARRRGARKMQLKAAARARDRASGASPPRAQCIVSHARKREGERGNKKEERKKKKIPSSPRRLVFSFSYLVARFSYVRLDCPVSAADSGSPCIASTDQSMLLEPNVLVKYTCRYKNIEYKGILDTFRNDRLSFSPLTSIASFDKMTLYAVSPTQAMHSNVQNHAELSLIGFN